MRLLIASRKSDLARLQSYQVASALKRVRPDLEIDFHFRESLGDKEQTNPLWTMPEKGVFTQDFVAGLIHEEFDLVVHSWKDLPTEVRAETEVVATLPRADVRDLLLVRKDARAKSTLKWRVLSSSPRRAHFLSAVWNRLAPKGSPELEFHSVRGNIQTRMTKLIQGDGDALLLAKAAVDRLLLATEPEFLPTQKLMRDILNQVDWMVLPVSVNPPAPAQGALAIEIKKSRQDLRELLNLINDSETFEAVQWERAQLVEFGGGCHMKLGALQRRFGNACLQIRMGQPRADLALFEKKLLRNSWPSGNHQPVALRTDHLFSVHPQDHQTPTDALYFAHPRTAHAPPASTTVWTSGLRTWEKLASLGVWVNGSDEGFGEARPNVDSLAGKPLDWKKLSHSRAPDHPIPVISSYCLSARQELDPIVKKQLESGTHFFWSSGSLFERALELVPKIIEKHHSCGLGSTRKTLEARLGSLSPEQIFLDEEDWRSSYEHSKNKS